MRQLAPGKPATPGGAQIVSPVVPPKQSESAEQKSTKHTF
jgi:hypothetical protein